MALLSGCLSSNPSPSLHDSSSGGRNQLNCCARAASSSRSWKARRLRAPALKRWCVKAAARPPEKISVSLEELGDALSASGVRSDTVVVVNFGPYLRRLPVKRVLVWAAVAFTLFQLRDFVGVIMGTIVLAMIGNTFISWAEEYLPGRRRFLIAAMYVVIIALLAGVGVMYIPKILQEGANIIRRIQQSENPYNLLSERLRHAFGENITDQLERFLLSVVKPDSVVLESMAGNSSQRSMIFQQLIKDYSGAMLVSLVTLISATSRFALQSFVSLIFSFLLVWDMPSVKAGIKSLEQSRLSVVYEEIAPVVATFGTIFGRALQAQSTIAVVNTILTGLGLLILRVSAVGWLSLLVFFCSFIPVAGVIISTVPIGVVAFVESGILKLSLVVLMVVLIHAIEAYVLNPAIYSAHLKLHPVLALGVLVFAEHALGVWGLISAVPMAVFFIEYIIKRNSYLKTKKGLGKEAPSHIRPSNSRPCGEHPKDSQSLSLFCCFFFL